MEDYSVSLEKYNVDINAFVDFENILHDESINVSELKLNHNFEKKMEPKSARAAICRSCCCWSRKLHFAMPNTILRSIVINSRGKTDSVKILFLSSAGILPWKFTKEWLNRNWFLVRPHHMVMPSINQLIYSHIALLLLLLLTVICCCHRSQCAEIQIFDFIFICPSFPTNSLHILSFCFLSAKCTIMMINRLVKIEHFARIKHTYARQSKIFF